MRFERLVDDGRLWSVIYDGDSANAFNQVFSQWNDFEWLMLFFKENADDLNHYFHITDVDAAIYDTVEEANNLECLILDLSSDISLDRLFRPLNNLDPPDSFLSKEKAKGRNPIHASWLRIYAIRIQSGVYIVTGGAIKLTATMKERAHTIKELEKMNKVRDFLVEIGISDLDDFELYNNG